MKNAKEKIKNVGTTEEEQAAYLKSRPYQAERRWIHKGLMAKPGYTHLVVTARFKGRKFTNVRQFPTEGLDQGVMNHLFDKMFEEIQEEYREVR